MLLDFFFVIIVASISFVLLLVFERVFRDYLDCAATAAAPVFDHLYIYTYSMEEFSLVSRIYEYPGKVSGSVRQKSKLGNAKSSILRVFLARAWYRPTRRTVRKLSTFHLAFPFSHRPCIFFRVKYD